MRHCPPADGRYLGVLAAMSRIIMPNMNIQVPPNLSPHTYHTYLEWGINDWGGVSPLTPDYVNPEFAWPAIDSMKRRCQDARYRLQCRFPVYPEFVCMVGPQLQDRMNAISDGEKRVREEYWR